MVVGEPFVLPASAAKLTDAERMLVLAVVEELLTRQGDTSPAAPVVSLAEFRRKGDL